MWVVHDPLTMTNETMVLRKKERRCIASNLYLVSCTLLCIIYYNSYRQIPVRDGLGRLRASRLPSGGGRISRQVFKSCHHRRSLVRTLQAMERVPSH